MNFLSIDVSYSDPLDPKIPLLSAPNVVMTPHIGGSSKENLLRIGDIVVEILRKWKKVAEAASELDAVINRPDGLGNIRRS